MAAPASDAARHLAIREARAGDLEAVIRLHEADAIGGHGDVWNADTRPGYEAAFHQIAASPFSALFVAEAEGVIVGTFQVTMIPTITGGGRPRAKVESVQVDARQRGMGIGAAMMAHAENWARECGAAFVELGSNKARKDAHRFYERLGYTASHEGFKKRL
ncbi:MAG: GNAT family N-acetyltransferase [Salinarimonas sp.]